MLCPNCSSEIEVQETINQSDATWRQKKCKLCGFKFFTKETVCSSDEAQPLFTEWTRERSRKSRAKKKGIDYNDDDGEYGTYNVNGNYSIGVGILGAGIAAMLAGGIVMGIMGYYYTHTNPSDMPLSFHISPMSANMSFSF